ncbi:glycerol channel [Entomophthora muscae]|uniref:Glycerol channel n=1 Tax=Entomophthora muscae TaxID=34485 RepID=A0ACC2S0V5_9FUNG|nr:glycerol channel [Entomophthora muscae]
MSDKEEFEIEEQLPRQVGLTGVKAREFLAEMLGSFVLTVLGHGAILQVILHPKADVLVGQMTIGLGIGLGLAMAVYTAGHTSGGHVNPAITVAFAAFRGFPWQKVPMYILAQVLGSLFSAAALFLFNYPAITAIAGPSRLGLFASMPPPGVPYGIAFVNIFAGATILLMGVMALTDPRNSLPPWQIPLGIALLTFSVCIILPGYPLSPSWDFAMRLAAMPISKSSTFSPYAFIPILAPILGGTLGIAIYDTILPPL